MDMIEWIVLYAVTYFLSENFLQFAKSSVRPLSNPNRGQSTSDRNTDGSSGDVGSIRDEARDRTRGGGLKPEKAAL